VEEGQDAGQRLLGTHEVQDEGGLHLLAVAGDVVVREHHALGQAGGSGGEGQEDHVVGGGLLGGLQVLVSHMLGARQLAEIDGTLGQGLLRTGPHHGDGNLLASQFAGLL